MIGFSRYAAYVEQIAGRNFAMLGALVIVAIPLGILEAARRWRPSSARALSWAYVGAFYATMVYSVISFCLRH